MKVLQINAVYGYSSTGRICVEMEYGLTVRGHQCVTAYGNGMGNGQNCFRMGNKYGVKLHSLLARLSGTPGYFSRCSTDSLIKYLREYQPDIVHLHNLHGNYIHVPMLLKYLGENDIPTVLTLHDCWFFTGKCTHYTVDGCDRWQNGCKNCIRLKKDIPSWLFDRTEKMWRDKKKCFEAIPRLAVVGVSDWITDEAKKSFLGSAKIVRRIYNWIDLDVFCPQSDLDAVRKKYCIPEHKFIILGVAAGWNAKMSKLQDFIRLSGRLDREMQMALVGRQDNPEMLPGNIITIPYVESPGELARLYSLANVYVHLSREDTFGKVIAEAMACGTPAIVYQSTACPELIGDGCGYTASSGSVEEVFSLIQRVRNNTKDSYSTKCTEFARKQFEKEMLIEQQINLYRALIDGETEC